MEPEITNSSENKSTEQSNSHRRIIAIEAGPDFLNSVNNRTVHDINTLPDIELSVNEIKALNNSIYDKKQILLYCGIRD